MGLLTTGPVISDRNLFFVLVSLLNNSSTSQDVTIRIFSLNGEKTEFDTATVTLTANESATEFFFPPSAFEVQIQRDSEQVAVSVYAFDGNVEQVPSNTFYSGDFIAAKYTKKAAKKTPQKIALKVKH